MTFLFVALAGSTVAVSFSVFPFARERVVLFSVTPVTETVLSLTVTVQDAVLFPSSVVALITAVPAATAVTVPVESTVATLVLLEDQVTFLFVASAGSTVAVSFSVFPFARERVVLFNETPVTETALAEPDSYSLIRF